MEEVDQIIISSFLNIGCEFAENLQSLKQLTTENVVEATVKCLKVIDPDIKMSHVFPPGMSARFRVGSAIAQACQKVGYRDNIGYETFLYSSESDIRKIFMFLVEKLPRKEGVKDDQEGSASVLRKRIGQVLREHCKNAWMPPYCNRRMKNVQFKTKNLQISYSKHSKKKGKDENFPFIHEQVSNHDELTPSVLELNANGLANYNAAILKKDIVSVKKSNKASFQWKQRHLVPDEIALSSSFEEVLQVLSGSKLPNKQSRFANAKKLQFTTSEQMLLPQTVSANRPAVPKKPAHLQNTSATPTADPTSFTQQTENLNEVSGDSDATHLEETEEEKFVREETELKELIQNTEASQTEYKRELRVMEASIQQMKLEINETEDSSKDRQEKLDLKKKTVYLLPKADESMEKLKKMIEKNSQRLVSLGKLWEERRIPLVQEMRTLKKKFNVSEFDAEKKLEEIKELRMRMKEAGEETKRKEQMIKQLTSELESMKRDISRQSYTKRILEIVSSIHKQQMEIQRVISDMKDTQKLMNQMKGRIDRTFTAADEAMFKDAKKDDNIRQAYKYLVALHDNCAALVITVEETGAIMREIRELEDQIEIETKKNAQDNLAKITKDYKEVKKENADLMKRLPQN